ncbi:ABC transporter ATP-binding protein [Cupriavidus sp. CuC1]|uniref:ABC transporter ATP-binding protein n=1 Tax=Cupriavidus sp. CuC1 TaxID=3373131 RepID=UPI0037CFB002
MALLEIRDLQTWFDTRAGVARAVDGVTLSVARGETVALVGESGSGKSMTACSVLRLIPRGSGRIVGGQVLFDGVDLLALPDAGIRAIRGNRIGMIFQEPLSALNPVLSIGHQIAEAIRLHRRVSEREAWARAVALLDQAQIPSAQRRVHDYPHQLSGGMRQRAMIAIALACEPDLLIADEPTTALDVTTQAQILDLLKALQAENGMGLLLITHDLGVVAEIADRAAVMYAGRVVEEGRVDALFAAPAHPYAEGLLASLTLEELAPGARLPEIPGTVPSLLDMPGGCAFAPRCAYAADVCRAQAPLLRQVGDSRRAACHAPLQAVQWAARPHARAQMMAREAA